MEEILTFEGCNYFRQRLVLATLSSKAVRITKLRKDEENPGLREFEAGFIRLLDKLTNGSRIEVNETGTSMLYQPGLLMGGTLEHDCSKQRSISYFLESLLMLAPFLKKPLRITLRGITNGPDDPSVDYYRLCVLPLLKQFIPDNELELKIRRRGMWPDGNGEVFFSCPIVKRMRPVFLMKTGRVRRVRGVAYCVRVSPSMANRMVDSSRALLNKYLPDVYIYTDIVKGGEGGKSPGYGITLIAESTTKVMYAGEAHWLASDNKLSAVLPEELGAQAVSSLIEEIVKGGCADSVCQVIPLLFMALGQKDVSKIQLGELTEYSTQFLRHIKDFFQLAYKVEGKVEELGMEESNGDSEDCVSRQIVSLSCVGIGFSNFSKGIL
ncbi:RNA 3'-terminal phosphate cyclase-like protein [Halichondria panicea]|uniref:RNA 3'-terminal phosphate cyclase-like protein n=1 Tax=Halichondria panicea TaxID=6063 RepID=UPI00312B768A